MLLAQMRRTQILLKFLQLQPNHQRQHVRTDDHLQPSVDQGALVHKLRSGSLLSVTFLLSIFMQYLVLAALFTDVTLLLIFHVVFTTVLWNLLVFQTNLYYSQSVAVKPSLIEWVVTVDEMMAFIDIVIAMGVVRLSEIDDYWATDPILQHPWFASVM